jgi:flagellar biosynthesis protein FliP
VKSRVFLKAAATLCLLGLGLYAPEGFGATGPAISVGGVTATLGGTGGKEEMALALKILLGLTVLSLAPALLVSMTSFVRVIIVLSMLRHALGMQETPPNTVLISLALFLTLFTMTPVLDQMGTRAFTPFVSGKLSAERAFDEGMKPLRDFMMRQTREQDFSLMVELSKKGMPETAEGIGNAQLIPAFMLSELRSAFQIGFVIFLPFLLIDLVVSSILMSLGMMMVPPATIALPIKILMFILIDGWNLVIRSLIGTFQ